MAGVTSSYPAALDSESNLTPPNNGDTLSVADHWLAGNSGPIVAIETELGTDPAGSHTNVKGRLDQVDSAMGFKNRIIGGNFSTNPWQRGTSFTGPADTVYTADRFKVSKVGVGVFNIDKTAEAPTIAEAGVFTQHCLHADVTTIDGSIVASDLYAIQHVVEGYNLYDLGFGQSGTRYLTLSFWHKHTVTGTYSVAFSNSALNRSYVAEYTQSTTNTWEKAELTIPVDTSGTWLYDNNVGLRLYFAMATGSTYAGAAGSWSANDYRGSTNQVNALATLGNDFKIALVQLEAGDKATRFETRSVGQELELCQRYFEKSYSQGTAPGTSITSYYYGLVGGSVADYATSSWNVTSLTFATAKRTTPSVTVYDAVGNSGKVSLYTGGGFVRSDNTAYNTIYVGERNLTLAQVQSASYGVLFAYTAAAEL